MEHRVIFAGTVADASTPWKSNSNFSTPRLQTSLAGFPGNKALFEGNEPEPQVAQTDW